MKCPTCKMEIADLVHHFRFVHQFDDDETTRTTFSEIERVEKRVDNLYELLEVKEK